MAPEQDNGFLGMDGAGREPAGPVPLVPQELLPARRRMPQPVTVSDLYAAAILDELRALRSEVAGLRAAVAGMERRRPEPDLTPTGGNVELREPERAGKRTRR